EMVRRGIAPSRSAAARMVDDSKVLVSGSLATKAGRLVGTDEPLVVLGPPPRFVGRGGEKLAAAIVGWALDPSGLRVLDAGASTGGFTDCLLQHGAASVTALDVGHGQLHERLRADPRVEVVERTNLRHVDPGSFPTFDAVVADLSFISLRTVMDVLVGSAAVGGWLVLLVKPQFEAGRSEVSRGRGVIADPQVWRRVLEEVVAVADRCGSTTMGVMVSPLHGADGNTEFLLHLQRQASDPTRCVAAGSGGSDQSGVEGMIDGAIHAAVERDEAAR
ncbi:MAG: TlyA family RNA methyltransferase, partial [Actinobacteria bacterium]|nr:TlyA family RNA methyltransferase [Actinomycetota bacterium]